MVGKYEYIVTYLEDGKEYEEHFHVDVDDEDYVEKSFKSGKSKYDKYEIVKIFRMEDIEKRWAEFEEFFVDDLVDYLVETIEKKANKSSTSFFITINELMDDYFSKYKYDSKLYKDNTTKIKTFVDYITDKNDSEHTERNSYYRKMFYGDVVSIDVFPVNKSKFIKTLFDFISSSSTKRLFDVPVVTSFEKEAMELLDRVISELEKKNIHCEKYVNYIGPSYSVAATSNANYYVKYGETKKMKFVPDFDCRYRKDGHIKITAMLTLEISK